MLRRGFLPSAVDSSAVRSSRTEKAGNKQTQREAVKKKQTKREADPKRSTDPCTKLQTTANHSRPCRRPRPATPNRRQPRSTTANHGQPRQTAVNRRQLRPATAGSPVAQPLPRRQRGLDFTGINGYTEKEEKRKNTAGAPQDGRRQTRREKSRTFAAGGRRICLRRGREKERL